MTPPSPNFQSFRPEKIQGELTRWKIWAPCAKQVELIVFDHHETERYLMSQKSDGVFLMDRKGTTGLRYAYSIDGGPPRPDPCTIFQPDGVHCPSALYFPNSYHWKETSPEIAPADHVLYEIHIGTFTREGTFDSAIERLDDLADLGVTTLEILPVAQFPGERNWGYDGVHPYATQNSYGGPAEFQRFIDAAHGRGFQVILDVVFNHLGPEGNYLSEFGPYFTDRYSTPWGKAFRFDDREAPQVRDWVLDCIWMWIHDFRIDGLRLDAVHAMYDSSERHILSEIKQVADEAALSRNGKAFIIAESLVNDPSMVTPEKDGGLGLDAEWNEDFHHALSAWMTGESHGKYVDYGGVDAIKNVLRSNLYLTGQHSEFYGKPWGVPAETVPPERYIISLQNHDHIGNRACGERLASLVGPRELRLGICMQFLSPFLPMLFMGEEYGETNPFLYFCSFSDPQLVRNVRRGRKRDYGLLGDVPDPQAESSFEDSKLSWSWSEPERKDLRQLVKDLISLRRKEPELRKISARNVEQVQIGDAVLFCLKSETVSRWFNLSEHSAPLPGAGEIFWRSEKEAKIIAPFEALVARE